MSEATQYQYKIYLITKCQSLFLSNLFTAALLISSGFALNLTVCAMLVVKQGKGDDIPLEMTEEDMKKGFKSWSGYYFSNQLYCVDEDAEKR